MRVAGSLAKQVYIAEKLAPPTSVSQVTSAYQQIWSSISKASWWTHSLPAGEWRKIAVYGVEAVGIFSIGEIVREAAFAVIWHAKELTPVQIGKRSLVGYKIKEHAGAHGHHH